MLYSLFIQHPGKCSPDRRYHEWSYTRQIAGHKIRKDYSDGDPDWESDFTILKNTLCASTLSENLFHDNPQDLAFLESAHGRQAIIDLHIQGIIRYINHQIA